MLTTIVAFFIVLGVIVLVHEAGHFVVARKAGVKIEEFGFGIPPRIIGIYKDDVGKYKLVGPRVHNTTNTIWSLNWVPLGGFVKIKGEQGDNATDADSFASKSIGVRAAILSAGVTMNIVLAVVLLSIGFMVGVPQALEDGRALSPSARVGERKIQVIEVLPDSPAVAAGIKPADTIIAIDDQQFENINTLQEYINNNVGQTIVVTVARGHETVSQSVVPEILPQTENGGMGVALVETALVSYPWYLAIWYGLVQTGSLMVGIIVGFFVIIKTLVLGQGLIGEVYGPVGIATLVGDAARLGVLYVLQFTAILSVIIAVINYLPFPALDGGRVLFLVIEKLRGRPVNQKFEALMHNLGFALLMALVVVVTFRDIARLSSGIGNLFSGLF